MYESAKISDRIKEIAKSKKIIIKEMLDACGLSKNALASMSSGGSTPKADNLAKIADYLGCSVDFLLGRDDVQKEKPAPETGDELEQNFSDSFNLLTDSEKKIVLAQIKGILSNRE